MTTAYGFLGQLVPGAASLQALYTVPTAKKATARVTVTNLGAVGTTFRVSVAPGGAADNTTQYIAYDEAIDANKAVVSAPVTLAAGDIVRVRSASGNVAFGLTGIVIDA